MKNFFDKHTTFFVIFFKLSIAWGVINGAIVWFNWLTYHAQHSQTLLVIMDIVLLFIIIPFNGIIYLITHIPVVAMVFVPLFLIYLVIRGIYK